MDERTIAQTAARLHWRREGDTGPDLLLVHGWASSSRMWQPLVDGLRQHARCWLVDLCGFGLSADAWQAPLTLDDQVTLLIAFCQQHDIRPRAVLGHSMGGMLTLKLALACPDLMERLVVICPVVSGKVSLHAERVATTRWGRSALAASRPLWRLAQARPFQSFSRVVRFYMTPHRRAVVAEDFRRANCDAIVTSLDSILREDLTPHLPRISHPALILVGGRDFTVPPDEGRTAARLMPNARLTEFPRAHHEVLDEAPDTAIPAVINFVLELYRS